MQAVHIMYRYTIFLYTYIHIYTIHIIFVYHNPTYLLYYDLQARGPQCAACSGAAYKQYSNNSTNTNCNTSTNTNTNQQ